MATKYVTKADLEKALEELYSSLNETLKRRFKDLHDDLKTQHFQKVLDAIDHLIHVAPGDTSNIMEKLMTLAGSVERLGAVVAKLVVDGQTVQTTIAALNQKIQDLIDAGSADAAALAALQAEVAAAMPSIDAHVTELEALDAAVTDPNQPALDPNAPVA